MRTKRIAPLLVLVMVAAACGSDSGGVGTADTTIDVGDPSASTTTAVASPTTVEPSPSSPTTTEVPVVATADPQLTPIPAAELAGEDFDIGPLEGTEVGVRSVRFDDTLNARLMPGSDQPVVVELDPTDSGLLMTGRKRLLPRSSWWELDLGADGFVWASSAFLAPMAATRDDTAWVIERLDGEIPFATELDDLGQAVAAVYADFDGAEPSIVVVVEGSVGDLGEITIDVSNYPDDALAGDRLVIFAAPGEGGFGLKSVEATALCRRGLTEEGELCV
ncbi:MAG: hypothetical protein GY698_10885 [Actinomycetia bacterium]|nr:hypothetical protein [Actinomycetes bacterium]